MISTGSVSSRLGHASRKYLRFLAIFVGIFFLLQLYSSSFHSLPRLQIVESSYNWSNQAPFYPVPTLQALPTARPQKLAQIQHVFGHDTNSDAAVQKKRREQVKETFIKGWTSYKRVAWMYDELTPLTGAGKDTFGGWAATLIDAMDTLWIMGLHHEFEEAVNAAITIDWAKVQGTSCNMFETTIRHLGGLLSSYDLSQEPALLAKAVELGDMLYTGFDTPNHMPPFWFDFEKAKSGRLLPDDNQPAASATTLSMEFTRLAQLTGNPKYYDAISRVTDALHASQNATKLPGMWPTFFNLRDGTFTEDDTFTLGALSDSMYEYLLKMYVLLGATEPKYEQLYRAAADTIIKNLTFRPMTPKNEDILFTGTYRAEHSVPLDTEGQHLACFAGGMFAMGGKLFSIPDHIDIGARLTRGCMWAYRAFPTGLAPEIFGLIPCESLSGCRWNERKWMQAVIDDNEGQYIVPKGFRNARDPRYILRPEALESVFILYRITGQEEYREAAWTMFQSIQRATATEFGNAAISDVTESGNVEQNDSMEVSRP